MITYEQALKTILKHTAVLGQEKIPIEESAGRILKEDIYSKIDMPPFDKSAMDGYAVNSADVKKIPVKLKCAGLIQAGENFEKKLQRGQCVKIMTGAPMPAQADSVVMVENTLCRGGYVEILSGVKKRENVCSRGEDVKRGQKVIEKNMMIYPAHTAILAGCGRSFVKVAAKPKVAVLNTGGEIVPPGEKLGKNKIYNSNGPMLMSLLKSDNIQTQSLGIAKDDISELKTVVKKGLDADMLLISGGVSMGDYDLIPGVLKSLGIKKVFHKVNIKPGKPLLFAVRNKTLIFGIPGNPVSNFLAYQIFIRLALAKLSGGKPGPAPFEEGILKTALAHNPGRKHFVLVKISKKKSGYYLTPVESHGSADILALSKADGFMIVDTDTPVVNAGAEMRFLTWKIKK
jgi:molybdopterin molybdotransferase